ncbi:MAG: hypothetical protein FJX65_10560 [Alphaproteobacteria bacterium]|nr:hypothetical protein [Alphaproteobacteria bacterium]
MNYVALAAAVLLGVGVFGGTPAMAACKDELAKMQGEVGKIKDAKKSDMVKKLWSEADAANRAGNEKGCMDKMAMAKKEAGMK